MEHEVEIGKTGAKETIWGAMASDRLGGSGVGGKSVLDQSEGEWGEESGIGRHL